MQATSPLGAFAAPVAALVAVGIVGAYIVSLFAPGVPPESRSQLQGLALLAVGAVLGSSVAANGYKAPVNAAHARIDKLQAAVEATAALPPGPVAAATVAAILENDRTGDVPPAQAGTIPPPM